MDPRERVFADIALRLQLLTREQVATCAEQLERGQGKHFVDAATELGMMTEDEAALVRGHGERVLGRKPQQAPRAGQRAAGGGVRIEEERVERADPRADPPARPRAARPSKAPKPAAPEAAAPPAQPKPRKRGPRDWEAPNQQDQGVIHVPRTAAAPPPQPGARNVQLPSSLTLSAPPAPMEFADTAPGATPDDEPRGGPPLRAQATVMGVGGGSPPRAVPRAVDRSDFDGFPLAEGDDAAHVDLPEPPPRPSPPAPTPHLGAAGAALLRAHASDPLTAERAAPPFAATLFGAAHAPAPAHAPALAPAPAPAHAPAPALAPAPAPALAPAPVRSHPPPKAAERRPSATMAPQDSYLGKALALALRHGASDLHVHSGATLQIRVDGQLRPLSGPQPLAAEAAEKVIAEITTDAQWALLSGKGEVDFACEIPGLARFRVNVYRQQRGLDAVFRIIPLRPPTLEELGLPSRLARLTDYRTGMVLCTGPAGCGKSTTLAALVSALVQSRADHILTVEDPVEYVFPPGRALVNQRQIGDHTGSFARALRAALREDPDIIAITELRDRETIALAISAAETGHLVLGTLHTGNASQTIHRMVSSFPADEQEQVRVMLSESLRAVVSQRLLPMAVGRGRVPAIELLMVNTAVSNLIREDKTHQLPSVMQTGRAAGMLTLDDSLDELVTAGIVTREAARRVAVKKERFA